MHVMGTCQLDGFFPSKQATFGQNDLEYGPDLMEIIRSPVVWMRILWRCAKTLKAVAGFQSGCELYDRCLLRAAGP